MLQIPHLIIKLKKFMRDFEDEKNEEEQDEELVFGKTMKSAVLEIGEDEGAEIIHADDSEFESDDSFEENEEGGGPVLYESEEDELGLQF